MGGSNSKHKPAGVTRNQEKEIHTEKTIVWSNMEGPSFHCAYLGFGAISKPPTNMSVLQNPIKELYFQYRKSPTNGRSANFKLIQKGVLLTLFENGVVCAELFFDFTSVTFVEAARFLTVKTSSDRKLKAMFVPIDDRKATVSEKQAFALDKTFHFLASTSHPPLVACVVRRPAGVKALDCHVFALDTAENALHITALIGSTQVPSGQGGKSDAAGDASRVKSNFDRGIRGDVIRTDRGEYSVYRGAQTHDGPQPQQYSGGPVPEMQQGQRYSDGPISEMQQGQRYSGGPIPEMQQGQRYSGGPIPEMQQGQRYSGGPIPEMQQGQRYSGGPIPEMQQGQRYSGGPIPEMQQGQRYSGGLVQVPGRNGNMGYPQGGIQGPIMLTQDNFREPPTSNQQSYGGGGPGPRGYGMYEHPNYGNPSVIGYAKPPDVIINAHQRSVDSAEQLSRDRTHSGSEHSSAGVRVQQDDVQMRNSNNTRMHVAPVNEGRLSGGPGPVNRLSGNQVAPGGKTFIHPGEPTPVYMTGLQRQPDSNISSVAPFGAMTSPTAAFSPMRDDFGPVFSASNLESRGQASQPEQDHTAGGRPVAKVPPHMKGVKVLPSDFRMIKLKPKNEKRTESSDDYDNNKEVMEKYKEYQEREKEVNYTGGIKASVVKTNSQETDGFIDFTEQNKQRTEERSRDFSPQWNETIKEKKSTGRGFDSTGNNVQHIYGDSRDHAQRHEDNNNRNIGQGENWTNKLQPNVGNAGDAHVRTKDLEIANMFSNVKLQDGNDSRNMYRQQQGVRNEIEEGLGYLP